MKPLLQLASIFLLLVTTHLLSAQTADTAPSSIQPYKTVGDRTLSLHIFDPKISSDQPRPCVLLIHGGGWVNGTPEKYYFIARPLRDMGFVVACLQYRLYNTKTTPPVTVADAVNDARDAMRYLRTHARELNIDPARVVACGGSAGAHLAAGLALFTDDTKLASTVSARPDALVLFNPVIDTSTAGYGHSKLGSDWKTLSPLHQVRPGVPPTVVFHGTADRTVPFAGPQAFHEAMLKAGNVCEFHPYTGGDHGYYQKEPVFSQVMETIRQFCVRQKMLPATATTSPQS